jgi:hypothetical protein
MSGSTQAAPTASMTVSAGQANIFPVSVGYYPREGSRCVTAQYNWTAQAAYFEDLSQLEAHGVETTIQCAYVDNSLCSQGVVITVAATGQVVNIPASSQGVIPLLFSGAASFSISTSAALSNAVTRVSLLNFPLSSGMWHI